MPQSNQARVPQLLSLCFGAWEPRKLSHVSQVPKPTRPRGCALQQDKPLQREEARTLQLERPPLPQLEKSLSSHKDPAQPKIKE